MIIGVDTCLRCKQRKATAIQQLGCYLCYNNACERLAKQKATARVEEERVYRLWKRRQHEKERVCKEAWRVVQIHRGKYDFNGCDQLAGNLRASILLMLRSKVKRQLAGQELPDFSAKELALLRKALTLKDGCDI